MEKKQKTKENNRNKTAIRLIGKGKERKGKELYFIVNSSNAEAEVWGIVN